MRNILKGTRVHFVDTSCPQNARKITILHENIQIFGPLGHFLSFLHTNSVNIRVIGSYLASNELTCHAYRNELIIVLYVLFCNVFTLCLYNKQFVIVYIGG